MDVCLPEAVFIFKVDDFARTMFFQIDIFQFGCNGTVWPFSGIVDLDSQHRWYFGGTDKSFWWYPVDQASLTSEKETFDAAHDIL